MFKKRKILSSEICNQYIAGKSIPEIADLIGMTRSTTRLSLIYSGVKLRTRTEGIQLAAPRMGKHFLGVKRGPMSELVKGKLRESALQRSEISAVGFSLKPNGYIEITKGPNKGRSVHVVTMEGIIGRRLKKSEVVHHKDRNRQNNDPKNLQLMTRSSHTKLHRTEGW